MEQEKVQTILEDLIIDIKNDRPKVATEEDFRQQAQAAAIQDYEEVESLNQTLWQND